MTMRMKNSGIEFPDNVKQTKGVAASWEAPVYGCRAWVNFDGSKDTSGTTSTANTARLIRASANVSSVVRNSLGTFTVNFTEQLPDANFCGCVS